MTGRKKVVDGDQSSVEATAKKLIAKKDWRILCGSYIREKQRHEFDFDIKVGDDVSHLPKKFLQVLKSEQVI